MEQEKIFSEETMERLVKMFGWYEENHPEILQDFRERSRRVMGYMEEMEKELTIKKEEE